MKPKRIKGRIETVTVERNGKLGREITDRYRQSREDGRQKAETAVVELGGAEKFEQRRDQKLQDNRRQLDGNGRREETREEVAKNSDRPQRDIPGGREPGRIGRPAAPDSERAQVPDQVARQFDENRPRAEAMDDRRNPAVRETPRVTQNEAVKPRPEPRQQRQPDDRRVARTNEPAKQVETRREPQRQADGPAPTQKEAVDRRREEQAGERQRQESQE